MPTVVNKYGEFAESPNSSTTSSRDLELEKRKLEALDMYIRAVYDTTSNRMYTPVQASEMLQQQYARAVGRRDIREMKRLEILIANNQ